MTDATIVAALVDVAQALRASNERFALVGGLAVSVRGEVRFTRDVDIVVAVTDDAQAEALVFRLRNAGYDAIASVEHGGVERLSTVRLMSPQGIKVDLLFASCGIEAEIVQRAEPIEIPGARALPVAQTEELLAMKILSMSERRLQDRIDARHLLEGEPAPDLARVRANLALIDARGYARGEDLEAKLGSVLDLVSGTKTSDA